MQVDSAIDSGLELANGVADPLRSAEERAVQRFKLELACDRRVSDDTYADCETILGRDALVAVVLLPAAYAGTRVLLNAFAVPVPETAAS